MATINSINKTNRRNRKRINRLQITVTLMLIITFLFLLTTLGNFNSYGDSETVYINVIVDTGQSLWSIAEEYTPDHRDVRETIRLMVNANNIESTVIYPGDLLKVPQIY